MTREQQQRTKIKICGLKRPEDITYVNEAKPDYCGFIIEFPKSSRNVTGALVRELTAKLNPDIIPVGVFVNAAPERVEKLLLDGTIHIAQLHGQEDEAYIRRIQKNTGHQVIKAFSVKTAQDIENVLKSPADYILLDQGGGGTGQTFDWSLIPEIDRPFFLAGGLGADNLEIAVRTIHPYAVDLSSSVETDGMKDRDKILKAVQLVHIK
jgi:phosphoribosylanthranilate isomerase